MKIITFRSLFYFSWMLLVSLTMCDDASEGIPHIIRKKKKKNCYAAEQPITKVFRISSTVVQKRFVDGYAHVYYEINKEKHEKSLKKTTQSMFIGICMLF